MLLTNLKGVKGVYHRLWLFDIFSSGPFSEFRTVGYLLLESWFLSPTMDSVIEVVANPLRIRGGDFQGEL
jgi:hypothetical protein